MKIVKAAEELINSDSLIVVDGEYTDDTIKQAFSEGYEKGYNQAVDDCCKIADESQYHVSGNIFEIFLKLKI